MTALLVSISRNKNGFLIYENYLRAFTLNQQYYRSNNSNENFITN